ncbi:hypothetical protein BD311DRAFT_854742 [Dichomitus squalens]|uniref:Fe2OG dioxygenase domain-containing protein n=1 Tax=Dichomitus squalens TaxID=114155 RepID=A0A4V2JZH2_9APHY|nr:hypothetical protein BD311DRAFT_854742 [Dichomitus squalens]
MSAQTPEMNQQGNRASERLDYTRGKLSVLNKAIVRKPPFCYGMPPLSDSDYTLFYGKEGDAQDKPVAKDIRVELYKLNVYGATSLTFLGIGQNAFFKPHVDTPRSELMFGSLVIIFPTPYKGGELMLRRPGRKEVQHWELDSSALLEEETQPSIAYVAFFSDVEHEVLPVTSGYRGKDSPSSHAIARSMPTNEPTFQHTLSSVLDDPMFLPDGGNLMSGLAHTYPLAKSYPDVEAAKQALKNVEPHLKASDGVILRVLRELSLDASLKIVYEARDSQFAGEMCYVMFDRVIKLPDNDHMIEGTASEYLEEEEGGQPVMAAGIRDHQIVRLAERMDKAKPIAVHWVTGNPKVEQEAEWVRREDPDVVYWRIWIFVRVGPKGQCVVASNA